MLHITNDATSKPKVKTHGGTFLAFRQGHDFCSSVQDQRAVLDFACAHTEMTEKGHALTLTIWGQAESTTARNVSKMSIQEISTLWTVSLHCPSIRSSIILHSGTGEDVPSL